jgi:hypothetical protein
LCHNVSMHNFEKLIAGLIDGARLVVQKPEDKMRMLVDEERDLANALLMIAKKYGKFNEDDSGIWAGYTPAKDNDIKDIGVKCANCALYEGGSSCSIISAKVEPSGYCRFAIIPDGVVKKK